MNTILKKFPMKEQLKGYYVKLFLLYFIFACIQNAIVLWISAYSFQRPSVLVLFLILWVPLIVVQNAIFHMFLKRVRGQEISLKRELFAHPNIKEQILVAILISLFASFFEKILNVFALVLLLYIPLVCILECLILVLRIVAAFAIYDGHSTLIVFNGTTNFLKAHFGKIMLVLLPYLLMILVWQSGLVYFMLEAQHVELFYIEYLTTLLFAQTIWMLISSLLLIPSIMVIANLYEQTHSTYFPQIQVIDPQKMASVEIEVTEVEEDANS